MLKTIKIKPKKEIQIPSYNELFKDLSKKKEQLSTRIVHKSSISNPINYNEVKYQVSNSSTEKNSPLKTISFKNTSRFNLHPKNSKIKFSKSEKEIKKLKEINDFYNSSYKIGFQEQSKRKVIIPDYYSPSRCKIILLFGDQEEYNKLKKERDELILNIKRLEDKIKNANEQLEQINKEIELISESNLQIYYERKKEEEEHENVLKEIPIVKEDIENIKNKINLTYIETKNYKIEAFKIKDEINEINIKIEEMKKLIEKQIKENAKIQHEIDMQKLKNEELKHGINIDSDSFIKDVTKLIPPKEKENHNLLNSLQ